MSDVIAFSIRVGRGRKKGKKDIDRVFLID